jgi:hypothetical protein
MSQLPYTYLLKWSTTGMKYYGVRYASGCHPTDLWNPYKTSSKHVKSYVQEYGNPDIISVRKVFRGKNAVEKAQRWEHTVLRRRKVITNPTFLNRTDNKSISPEDCGKSAKIAAAKRKTRNKDNWPALMELSIRFSGRTKETHPHIAAAAAKLAGRTKLTHAYLAKKATQTASQMAKVWEITSPVGEIITIVNMCEWCRNNNVKRGSIKNGVTRNGYTFRVISNPGVNP